MASAIAELEWAIQRLVQSAPDADDLGALVLDALAEAWDEGYWTEGDRFSGIAPSSPYRVED